MGVPELSPGPIGQNVPVSSSQRDLGAFSKYQRVQNERSEVPEMSLMQ